MLIKIFLTCCILLPLTHHEILLNEPNDLPKISQIPSQLTIPNDYRIHYSDQISGSLDSITSKCGQNCPSSTCLQCPCGQNPNFLSVKNWCQYLTDNKYDQNCCSCIVTHNEKRSNGNANFAFRNANGGSYDVGFWGINSLTWKICNQGRAPCQIRDNLRCAKMMFEWGRGWGYWASSKACGC